MIINLTNTTDAIITLNDLGRLSINAGATIDIAQVKSLADIAESDDLLAKISDTSILVNDGTNDLTSSAAIKYVTLHNILNEPRDRSGKLRVHQTSRKLGTRITWTGVGDDPSDPSDVGGGIPISFDYKIDQNEPLIKYIDFNIVENETWLHEGYLTWKDGHVDTLTLEMVPRVTEVTVSSGTYYNLYNGYLVIPAAGDGTLEVVSDITTHSGGLIYMPNNDLDEPPTAFWNADWNSETQRYENITPAPYGNGRYNIFAVEVIFARFINKIPLLSNGFIALNSSDTDQMGHGMRLKMTADTNKETSQDHNWSVACIMCMHREKSVN